MNRLFSLAYAVCMVCTLTLTTMCGTGAPLTDWTAPDVIHTPDAVDMTLRAQEDITNYSFRAVSNLYFIRMELRGPVTNTTAVDCMNDIDSQPGGASDGNGLTNTELSAYVGRGLTGIDEIVDAHYSLQTFGNRHFHIYVPAINGFNFSVTNLSSVAGVFTTNGTSMEWSIPTSLLPTNGLTVYGTTKNFSLDVTYDVAGPIVVGPAVPIVRFTSIVVDTNVSLRFTSAAGWVPQPWHRTNLLVTNSWDAITNFGSTYPMLSDGTYTVWFDTPTNTSQDFYSILSTN